MLAFVSCGEKKQVTPFSVSSTEGGEQSPIDLENIENAGELIVVTLSGPDTYYQYHGMEVGLQYALAENFANSLGLRLRMEIAPDTTSLLTMLKECKADVIACPMPVAYAHDGGVKPCGIQMGDGHWLVRQESMQLAEALDDWWSDEKFKEANASQKDLLARPRIRRKARAVYMDRNRGVISPYDDFLVKASRVTQWDWRLLAAMCYQESAFDPQATSWVGAKGLMQIMPATADLLGIDSRLLTKPAVNIEGASRYIVKLESQFQDIRNVSERQKFVLASYNGGAKHIRDAMRLAAKYGRNPQVWDAVSFFVLHLSEPRYYRDPVVKHGYMIGRETYNYVYSILDRWSDYRGIVHSSHPLCQDNMATFVAPERSSNHSNRFTRNNSMVHSKTDSIFTLGN